MRPPGRFASNGITASGVAATVVILSALPRRPRQAMRRELVKRPHAPSRSGSTGYCNHVSALLDQVQTGRDDRFVPLVVTAVAVEPCSPGWDPVDPVANGCMIDHPICGSGIRGLFS